MADVNIAGPARQLLRVQERRATLRRAEGLWDAAAVDGAVRLTFEFWDDGRRLTITLDRAAWEEIRKRIDRAFIPVELPGQMRLL